MKISFESNIGGGKSTLLTRIQKETRLPVFLEPIDKWTFLTKFYQDTKRWGLTFNIEVLMSMNKWKHNNYDSLYERSPISCRCVFTQMQYEQAEMCKEEFDMFEKLYDIFSWDQDVIIYIATDPEICFERMKQRNRDCEESVGLEYLKNVHKKHTDMIDLVCKTKKNIKVFTVDGNQNEHVVYDNVLTILNGLIEF